MGTCTGKVYNWPKIEYYVDAETSNLTIKLEVLDEKCYARVMLVMQKLDSSTC